MLKLYIFAIFYPGYTRYTGALNRRLTGAQPPVSQRRVKNYYKSKIANLFKSPKVGGGGNIFGDFTEKIMKNDKKNEKEKKEKKEEKKRRKKQEVRLNVSLLI